MDQPRSKPTARADRFDLVNERLGALPLVNHFLGRAGLPGLLERYLPATDARVRIAPAVAVRLVVTNLVCDQLFVGRLGRIFRPFQWLASCQKSGKNPAIGNVFRLGFRIGPGGWRGRGIGRLPG